MKSLFNERDKTRISVIFAFLIANGFMNYIVGISFGVGGMLVSLSITGLAMVFSYKTMVKVKFPATALVFAIIIGLYYIVTRRVSRTTLFGREFAFYFCAVSVMAMYKCNTEKLLRYLSYGSLVILFFYNDIFVEMTSSRFNNYISMGLSYPLFPLLLAPFFHFAYYREPGKHYLMYPIYVLAGFLLLKLMFKGTRGIILSVVVAMGLIYIKGMGKRNLTKAHIGRAVVVFILAILGIVYFYEIMGFVKEAFDSWGIEAHFLNKILRLSQSGNVSNGRTELFEYAWKEFLKNPILGHGISTMYYNSRGLGSYAHNFILQLLYDGGFVLAIPVLLIVVRAFYYVFCGDDGEEIIFTLFMICITIPRAFFTGDIWENASFWLFIMHSVAYHPIKRKKRLRQMIGPATREKEKPSDEGDEV